MNKETEEIIAKCDKIKVVNDDCEGCQLLQFDCNNELCTDRADGINTTADTFYIFKLKVTAIE